MERRRTIGRISLMGCDGMGCGMDLENELAVYGSKLPELKVEYEGKFVLIHGDQIVDFFSSYDDAIKAGYSRFGLEPFLVKQIHTLEAQFISRFVDPCAVKQAS